MGFASSRYECTIGTKRKGVKFFFNFFFSWGVGAWVGARGCGCLGRQVGAAGWGWAGAGYGRLDWDCRCRMDVKRLPGLTQPEIGLPARV